MTRDSEHRVVIEGNRIRSPRLRLRPWSSTRRPRSTRDLRRRGRHPLAEPRDAGVDDVSAMEAVIDRLDGEPSFAGGPLGDGAGQDRELVGSAVLLPLPPGRDDLQIGWQLAPAYWGQGLAAEAGHAVAHFAFESGVEELFAVVRPRNERGAGTARSIGMEWVGSRRSTSTCACRSTGCARASSTSPGSRDLSLPLSGTPALSCRSDSTRRPGVGR